MSEVPKGPGAVKKRKKVEEGGPSGRAEGGPASSSHDAQRLEASGSEQCSLVIIFKYSFDFFV